MSPPLADQPAELPRAPSVLTMAAPFGDPGLTFTLLYSTCTARSSSAATLGRKGLALVVLVLTLVCSSLQFGFALPPTPEPIEINQARTKHGGFLRDTFQVGSGAAGSDPELPQETPVTKGIHLKSPGGSSTSATQRLLSSTVVQKIFTHQVSYLAGAGVAAAILAILVHMMAGAAAPAPRDFNYRVPPAWSPEGDSSYSFRAFITDVSIWTMLTDLAATPAVCSNHHPSRRRRP